MDKKKVSVTFTDRRRYGRDCASAWQKAMYGLRGIKFGDIVRYMPAEELRIRLGGEDRYTGFVLKYSAMMNKIFEEYFEGMGRLFRVTQKRAKKGIIVLKSVKDGHVIDTHPVFVERLVSDGKIILEKDNFWRPDQTRYGTSEAISIWKT